ncbi:MAG: serine/threonine-protein phosphatase, partial [Deltaproteobacteria bacterium]|nr:serine/threonine-protein phosphatase [Deltaproteobacteria bacterium]
MTSDRLLTVASKTLEFVSGEGQTHRGIKRSENQDAVLVIQSEDLRLYAVADGMGGTHGGGRASQLAIATLEECVRKVTRWDENTLIAAFQTVHDRIREDAARNPEYANMGTTLVCLALHGDSVYLANIGDSRAYLLRDGKLQRLTMDHTLVADLVRSGTLSAEQAKSTPISHMLSQSLGSDAPLETDAWIGS